MAVQYEDLNQEIYESAVVSRYSRSTSRIQNFKVKDSFHQFVFNAVSEIADIIPTKSKDALSIDELVKILSDFPQVDELIRLPNYRKMLGLPLTTLIRML